jgi:GNAT superfamily N-acetyltransferase
MEKVAIKMRIQVFTTMRDCMNLMDIAKEPDFPCKLSFEDAKIYCNGDTVQTYGIYNDDELVSIMTATFCRVFPSKDSPTGKIVQISGAYTRPLYRHKGYAKKLLESIEEIAICYGYDYICCDSIADDLYIKNGFIHAPENESRLWKPLRKELIDEN